MNRDTARAESSKVKEKKVELYLSLFRECREVSPRTYRLRSVLAIRGARPIDLDSRKVFRARLCQCRTWPTLPLCLSLPTPRITRAHPFNFVLFICFLFIFVSSPYWYLIVFFLLLSPSFLLTLFFTSVGFSITVYPAMYSRTYTYERAGREDQEGWMYRRVWHSKSPGHNLFPRRVRAEAWWVNGDATLQVSS